MLNAELQLLCIWLKSNKLSLNVEKTFYMVFHRAKIKYKEPLDLNMNQYVLERTNSIKYLGVIIDNKLNWIEHIAYVKSKISKGIGIMYKARRCLNKKSLINLYHSYIYPYLIYCIEIWGAASQCHLNPIYLLQKKIIRIITFSEYLAHTAPIFIDLQILPLDKLFLDRVGIMMYKYNNGLLPDVMNTLYRRNHDVHSYNTRNNNHLRIAAGSRSFSNVSARVWNSLISNINIDVSLTIFKRNIKIYLLYNSLVLGYSR